MRLVVELLHHRLTLTLEHQDSGRREQHDSELDAYVERADHRDADPAAELDRRTRMGFGP